MEVAFYILAACLIILLTAGLWRERGKNRKLEDYWDAEDSQDMEDEQQ